MQKHTHSFRVLNEVTAPLEGKPSSDLTGRDITRDASINPLIGATDGGVHTNVSSFAVEKLQRNSPGPCKARPAHSRSTSPRPAAVAAPCGCI